MKRIVVMSKDEYNNIDDIENIVISSEEVKNVYMTEEEDGSYVGVEYVDGTCSVVGCGMDMFVSFEEMIEAILED